MNLSLVTFAVLALDVSPPRPPPAECRADGDCMMSTFEGCCGSCCPRAPFAVSREQDRNSRNRCAVVDCSQPRCGEEKCARPQPASAFRAICQQSRCVAVQANAPPPECASDSDCYVENRGSPGGCGVCGCCPGMNPVAVSGKSKPVREPEPERPAPPPRPLTKKETPPFGLNQGGPPPPQLPNCSPCPAPPQVRAVCNSGRCALSRVITLDE